MQDRLLQHLIPWVKGSWAPPYKLQIIATDRCNLKCRSCWQKAVNGTIDSRSYELSDSKLLDLIEEASNFGIEQIEIAGGGEPLIRRDILEEIVRRVKSLKMLGLLVTNGTLFDMEIIKELILLQWDFIVVSLDGPDRETNDFLRPPAGTFDKVINMLLKFRDEKKKIGSNKPEIIMNCVISRQNFFKLSKMIDLALKYELKEITFEPLKVYSEFGEELKVKSPQDKEFFHKYIKIMYEKIRSTNLLTNVHTFITYPEFLDESDNLISFFREFSIRHKQPEEKSLMSTICLEPWLGMLISVDGRVQPCCITSPFEDNVKQKSLLEIWLGNSFSNFRERLLRQDFPNNCKSCSTVLFQNARNLQIELKKVIQKEKLTKQAIKKLNICLVSREYPPETGWGGIGTYTYQLAHGLTNEGHNVHVISQSLDVEKEYMDNGVYVHRICHPNIFRVKNPIPEFARRIEYSWRVYQKICELIKEYNVDIVEGPNFSGECFVYSFFKKTPLITRVYTPFREVITNFGWPKTFDRRIGCWLEDVLLKRSDLITFSTSIYAEEIKKIVGLDGNRTAVIPFGIKLPPIENNFSSDGRSPTVLFVGRLEKRKGVHILMEAIPKVLKEVSEVNFTLVGRDSYFQEDETSFMSPQDKNFKTEFWDKLPQGLKERIQIQGYVSQEELANYYRRCDLFVAPSLHETFGLIYLEAMSYAKPVIGTNVGGIPEVIKDGEVGLLIPPRDADALANAIINLLKEESLRRRMGEKARIYVETNFSVEKMVEKTIEEFDKVLSKV